MSIAILLVEDDRSQAWLIREMIRNRGGEPLAVQRAMTLNEAIDRLTGEPFDAVLLDLNLPDSEGLDTFRRLSRACPAVPVVVLTGADDESLAVEAVREGAQDYLVKGKVHGGVLVRSLRYAIERHRREQAERQLIEVQEKERQRIARELHDGVLQSLVTMRLQLQMLAERIEAQHPSLALTGRTIADESALAAEEVRRISCDLHPQILDSRRLCEAIHWLGRKLQAEAGVRVELDAPLHDPLDASVKRHLFRIFQEAMRNAIQHGNARTIRVRLHAGVGEVALMVEDDGRGFDTETAVSADAGLGIVSIRERVQVLQGAVRVESRPGLGTLVAVQIPLPQNAFAPEIA